MIITERKQTREMSTDALYSLVTELVAKQTHYSLNWQEVYRWAWSEIEHREGTDDGDSLWPDQEPLEDVNQKEREESQ